MMTELNIHREGSGVIPAFDTSVILVTGGNSVAFFDYIGEDSYEMGDKTLTRAEAEATIDTPESAYIAGVCGEMGGMCFIWLNEQRLTSSVVAEESQHCAVALCWSNQIAPDGEISVELTHEVTEAVTLALTDNGFTVRNDIATEDATENTEEDSALDVLMEKEEGVTLSARYERMPFAKIERLADGTILDSWDQDEYIPNAGLPPFVLDTNGELHLMIFDYIGKWLGVDPRGFIALCRFGGISKIHIWGNSLGGDVDATATARGLITSAGVPVSIHMFGLCGSAMTFIGLVPNAYIEMDPMSWQMIHRAQSKTCGDAVDMKFGSEILEKFDSQIFAAYGARIGKTGEEFLAMVNACPNREMWLTANECLAMGLIDAIATSRMPQLKVAASPQFKTITPPERFTNSLSPITSPKSNQMEDPNKGAGLMGTIRNIFGLKDPGDEQPMTPEAKALLEIKAQMDAKDAEISALKAKSEKEEADKAAEIQAKADAEAAVMAKAKAGAQPVVPPVHSKVGDKTEFANIAERMYHSSIANKINNA